MISTPNPNYIKSNISNKPNSSLNVNRPSSNIGQINNKNTMSNFNRKLTTNMKPSTANMKAVTKSGINAIRKSEI